MAESMLGLKRSHRCTEVNNSMIGNEVTVMGWVQKSRNKGGIIFVDLRDRSGILQVIFEEANCGAESFAKAEKLRSEFVVAIVGKVAKRGGAINENLATGDIVCPVVVNIVSSTRFSNKLVLKLNISRFKLFLIVEIKSVELDVELIRPILLITSTPLVTREATEDRLNSP